MQLSPSQPIPVSYSVLPTDTTLYYVQSVLRDTTSNKILQKINLTQDPNALYRYTGAFAAVSDPSGLGRPVDITTIVYTDSGHTVLSQNYAAAQFNYVVLQPWIPTLGAGGGGSIDYKKLEAIIVAIIEGREPTVEARTTVQYGRIANAVSEIVSSAKDEMVKMHKEHIDSVTPPLLSVLEEMRKSHADSLSASGKQYEESVRTILDRFNTSDSNSKASLKEALTDLKNTSAAHHQVLDSKVEKMLAKSLKEVRGILSEKEIKLHFKDDKIPFHFSLQHEKQEEEEKPKTGYSMEDVTKLLS